MTTSAPAIHVSNYRIPRDIRRNVAWRRAIFEEVSGSERKQAALQQRMSESLLFWANLCGWIYEPRGATKIAARGRRVRVLPFVSWDYQDDVLLKLQAAVDEQHDILIEKSRDMGATWCCLLVFTWYWLFHEMLSFGVCSRNEKLVYKKGDPKAHFSKIEFVLDSLPPWLRPDFRLVENHLENPLNGSVIDGQSSTGQVGRGDRLTALLLDELPAFDEDAPGKGAAALSASADATDCRILNGTPGKVGQATAFYRIRETTPIKIIRLHWSIHPMKGVGLYTTHDGKIELLDEGYEYDPAFEFVVGKEGKLRSPWYDRECKRRGSARAIAQELDIEYAAAGGAFFDLDVLTQIVKRDLRPPYHVGQINYELNRDGIVSDPSFEEFGAGRDFRLWFHLGENKQPPKNHNYVVAADIADGTGASNSVISVGDTTSREKIAEFASPNIMPEDLGRLFTAICLFFSGQIGYAFGIWEANGPGRIFGQEVHKRQRYRNIYWRRREDSDNPTQTSFPGWFTTPTTKATLLGGYRGALGRREVIVRSSESIDEAEGYVISTRGDPVAARTIDERTGAREQHGDRVIADALMWWGMQLQPAADPAGMTAPYGSYMERRRAWEASQGPELRW